MASFPVSVALRLRDLFSAQLRRIFRRAEVDAEKTGDRMGAKLRKGIGKRAGKIGRNIIGGTGAVLGAGVVGGLAQAGARVREFETRLEDVRVQMGRTRPEAHELRQAIRNISNETGVSRSVILDGADAIANLQGNTSELNEKLDVLARASVASRAPVEDLASTWDALDKAFFKGQGSAKDMEGALNAAIQAGKEGSVPLSQMGTLLGRVATQFDDVAVSGKAGIADMVAALQVVKGRGFGEAAEAATGMNAAIKQLIARGPKLRKLGIKVFDKKDGKRQLRDLRTILDQMRRKGLDDPVRLQQALKDAGAVKFIGALLDENVRKKWDSIANSAANANTIQEDFAAKQETSGARISRSLNELRNRMDDAFTPERVEALTAALAAFVVVAGEAADAVGSIGEGIGELAGQIAVATGLAGRQEELGTEEAVAEDLARREQMARTRAEATRLGVLRGGVISREAVEATAEERSQAEAMASRGFPTDVSPEAAIVSALLAQREEGVGLRVGEVAPRARFGGEVGELERGLIEEIAAERDAQRQRDAAAAAAAVAAAVGLNQAAQAIQRASQNLETSTASGRDTVNQAQLSDVASNAPSTGAR